MMGPQTMRRIDRFCGLPACLLLTALRRLRRRTDGPPPMRRVLFVQLAESGSMVLADPAMRAVAERSGARVYCLTFARNRDSLAIAGTVAPQRIFTLNTDGIFRVLGETFRVLRALRREGIDTVIDLELFSRLSAALCFLTGAARRAGFHRVDGVGAYRGDLYTHPLGFDPRQHVAQNYLRLVECVIGDTGRTAAERRAAGGLPQVRRRQLGAQELERVARSLDGLLGGGWERGRLVLVNANASAMLPQRRWPERHFAELIAALLARHADVRVLLIGALEDRATTAAIAARLDDARCVDGAGRFALPELPALFAQAAAMLSNDSGPAHFAAVTALPVVVLFGPETPRLFRPLGEATVLSAGLACSPCVNVGNQRSTRCRDNQCMQRIAVGAVLAALEACLARRASAAARQAAGMPEAMP